MRLRNKQASKLNPLVPALNLTTIINARDEKNNKELKEALKLKIKEELDDDIELSIRKDFVNDDLENYG